MLDDNDGDYLTVCQSAAVKRILIHSITLSVIPWKLTKEKEQVKHRNEEGRIIRPQGRIIRPSQKIAKTAKDQEFKKQKRGGPDYPPL